MIGGHEVAWAVAGTVLESGGGERETENFNGEMHKKEQQREQPHTARPSPGYPLLPVSCYF